MRKNIVAFVFYIALAVIFTAPLSLDPANRVANDGDPLHISWILAWDVHQLLRDPLALFDSNSFYPYESSLAFSEHLIVQAVLVAPIQIGTGNAVLAQNAAMLLALALSGWGMFLFVREVLDDEDAALVGGVLFAFNTYMLHEVPRLQVLSLGWWPLTALYLYRALETGRGQNYVLFGFFYLLQCLSCTYYLLYVSLTLPIWVVILWWTMKRGDVGSFAKLVVPGVLVAVLVSLFSLPYLRLFRRFAYRRELGEGQDLLDYIRPPEGTALGALVEVPILEGVTPHFLGVLAIVLALGGLISAWRRRGQRSAAANGVLAASLITGITGVALSLGPTVHVGGRAVATGLYSLLYDYVPLFRGLRSPERISVLATFALAIFGSLGFIALRERVSGSKRKVLTAVVLVLLPLEHFTGGHFGVSVPTSERAPEVYRFLCIR